MRLSGEHIVTRCRRQKIYGYQNVQVLVAGVVHDAIPLLFFHRRWKFVSFAPTTKAAPSTLQTKINFEVNGLRETIPFLFLQIEMESFLEIKMKPISRSRNEMYDSTYL